MCSSENYTHVKNKAGNSSEIFINYWLSRNQTHAFATNKKGV